MWSRFPPSAAFDIPVSGADVSVGVTGVFICMGESDRSAVIAADLDCGPSPDPLIRGLESVYLALEGIGLAPEPSPIPVRRLNAARDAFAELAEGAPDRLVVQVTDRGLETVAGPLDPHERPRLEAMGKLLHALDIERLEIGTRPGVGGLERFIEALDSIRRNGRADDPPEPGEAAETVRIRFRPEHENRIGGAADDPWENLTAALGPGGFSASADPPAIDMPPTDRGHADPAAATRRKFTRRVAALNPRMRRDLLRIHPRGAEPTWAVLADLGDPAIPAEMLAVLQDLDGSGSRLTDQTLTLVNKLIRLSRSRPSAASEVAEVMERWGVAPAEVPSSHPESRRTTRDVLERREKLTFNPKPYQSLLDELSRSDVTPHEIPSLAAYRDPRDLADVRRHAGEIAAGLLASTGGERYGAGLFAYVGAAADAMIASGEFARLREAAVAARGFSLIETEHERTQRAAQRFLDDFSEPHRIAGILRHGCGPEGVDDDAASLLVLGGVVALGLIFDKLATHPSAAVVRTLRDLAADRSLPELRHVIEWRSQRGWRALRPVFPVIGMMRIEDRFALLETLFTHPEPRVRRQAIAMTDRFDGHRARMLDTLRLELRSDHAANAAVALRVLIKTPGDGAIEALGDFVARDLPRGPLWERLAARCVTALVERGPAGVEKLCSQLDRERSWSLPRMRVATRVAAALERYRCCGRVSESLRAWRRSPAGVAARMTSLVRRR